MTPEQMMQAVVETAGECWHEATETSAACFNSYKCAHCGVMLGNYYNPAQWTHTNPSPDDLNALFRLAEKLEVSCTLRLKVKGYFADAKMFGRLSGAEEEADTSAEALLTALHQAIKGE